MFAIARHLGEHPTFIGSLVGFSMANSAVGPLEEMLEQPGSPNLYWALAKLPDPLVSLQRGADAERVWPTVEFRDLDESAAMGPEQMTRLMIHLEKLVGDGKATPNGQIIRAGVEKRIKTEGWLEAARARLVDWGFSAERLKTFPPEQIILLDEKRESDAHRDDVLKLMSLPYHQAAKLAGPTSRRGEPPLFADQFVAGLMSVYWRQGKLQQRLALLQHVEALRMYAAEHPGTLPRKLSDASVPLPDDPFTGEPFPYEVKGSTAHIRGTPPPGEPAQDPSFRVRYEVTLQE